MQRRDLLRYVSAFGLLAASGIQGCSSQRTLLAGVHPWIGYESLYLADQFGWFGPNVSLVRGSSAADSVTGLMNGQLSAAALTLDEVLRVRAEGVPLTVCAVMDVSAGADALVVRDDITSLGQLRGKRVAVEPSALGALLLNRILEEAGLSTDDIEIVDLQINQQVEAWRENRIDCAVSYEPTVSRLRAEGAIRLFDSRQVPDTIFDVLVVDSRFSFHRGIRDLVHGHFRGLRHLLHNNHDALYRVATHQNIEPEQVRSALAGVMFPDVATNYRYMASGSVLWRAAGRLNEVMVKEGFLQRQDNLDKLFDDRWLPPGGLE